MSDSVEKRRRSGGRAHPSSITDGGEIAYERAIDEFASDLLAESRRLAASRQSGFGSQPEVTSYEVLQARKYLIDSPGQARSWLAALGQVLSYVAAIVSGYFTVSIDRPFGAIGLVATVLVGVGGFLLYSFSGRRDFFDEKIAGLEIRSLGDAEQRSEFLGRFSLLQREIARVSGMLSGDDHGTRPLGDSVRLLEATEPWTPQDTSKFQGVLAMRNSLVHDTSAPQSLTITQARDNVDSLMDRVRQIEINESSS